MFINWGNETPEQLAARRRAEEIALMEQAAFIRASKNKGGAVGGGTAGADSEGTSDLSSNSYVEDGYVDNYFE